MIHVADGHAKDFLAFLTTEPNRVVAPLHEKAMPVILRNEQEIETWLSAAWTEAKVLQRPLPDDEPVELDEPRQHPEPAAATQGFLL